MSEIFYPHRGVNASKEQLNGVGYVMENLRSAQFAVEFLISKTRSGEAQNSENRSEAKKKKGRRKQEHLRVAGALAFSAPLVSETPPRPRHKKKNFKGKHDDQNSATLSLKRAEIVCYFFL